MSWKIRDAAERVLKDHDVIGHQTGAKLLAIVYPHEKEAWVLKEWRTQAGIFSDRYDLIPIDLLQITTGCMEKAGIDNILEFMNDPMPGSCPDEALATLWVDEIMSTAVSAISGHRGKQPVLVIQKTAALYPVTGPRFLLQQLWDKYSRAINCLVVIFIPGEIIDPRQYRFLNIREEYLYRGILL